MFTGIIRGRGLIVAADPQDTGTRFRIRFPDDLLGGLETGASVAVDGVCLTVVRIAGNEIDFDVVAGTLALTNLGDRRVGDEVNLERSARLGDEVGGHHVSGHVSTTGVLTSVELEGPGSHHIEFQVDPEWTRYIFLRGFLAVDGASLTVAEADSERGRFRINLIPETLRNTCFRRYRVGDRVNIEVEHQTQVLVDVVTRTISAALAGRETVGPRNASP
ncbi:riboflavin synthase [Methylococcus capsulatus]|jgi:riboflavin synthase|uniref:Riboflavin synthase n=1 Tax=Methylococcus capsulatus TaxID=414 RepID=A0AA35UF84_METCP|nr:riboflavin synthase [Methylococcus capsulatus]QXP87492.1 riboflavin synthase [Methylococcus capsulatus]QXP91154.1 riboflavin synthase [Methylococcus capsulatus]QXP92769.1 riboflavin synthase [Methylococcus capsulatus]UQN12501.1 riboflavin synthase [Methylococcus capsulatus]CAI8865158.1 Riboflavin synthase [Methylococcus capsulatus]